MPMSFGIQNQTSMENYIKKVNDKSQIQKTEFQGTVFRQNSVGKSTGNLDSYIKTYCMKVCVFVNFESK